MSAPSLAALKSPYMATGGVAAIDPCAAQARAALNRAVVCPPKRIDLRVERNAFLRGVVMAVDVALLLSYSLVVKSGGDGRVRGGRAGEGTHHENASQSSR